MVANSNVGIITRSKLSWCLEPIVRSTVDLRPSKPYAMYCVQVIDTAKVETIPHYACATCVWSRRLEEASSTIFGMRGSTSCTSAAWGCLICEGIAPQSRLRT
jgi:hypothetical protein